MKKIMLSAIVLLGFTFAAQAQEAKPQTAGAAMTKEEKAKIQQQKEADQKAQFDGAGLDVTQQESVKAAMADANAKSKVIKADATLSEDDKKAKLKENSSALSAKIKELIGEEKYKKYNEIKKQQKAAAEAAAPAKN